MSERRRARINYNPIPRPAPPKDPSAYFGDSAETILDGPLAPAFDTKSDRENGFPDRADSILSLTGRTLKISPTGDSFDFFVDATRFTKTDPQSVTFDDQDGDKYVYFDENGVLQWGEDFDSLIISRYASVAFIYWSVSDQKAHLLLDERHGSSMSSVTHSYLHATRGTQLESGLALTGIDADASGNDATSAQYAVADGIIWDEDLRSEITDGSPQDISPTAQLPVFHLESAGVWTSETATSYPVVTTGTGRLAWNENVAGTWQLTEAGDNSFVCYHTVATTDINNPVFVICGQAEYGSVAAAQAGARTELLNLELGALASLSTEWVLLGTTIWQTSSTYSNAVKGRIRSTESGDDYLDWRDLPRTVTIQAELDLKLETWEQGTHYLDGSTAIYITFGVDGDWEATKSTVSGTTSTGSGQTGTKPTTLAALQALTYA